MTAGLERRLDRLVARADQRPDSNAVRVAVRSPSTGWTWTYGDPDAEHFVASVTKLMTTAVVLRLVDEGSVRLDAPVRAYLGDRVDRLHVLDGVDRTGEITVRRLLAHTSGLPDYMKQRRSDGTSTFTRVLRGDLSWTFDDVLEISRGLRPAFPPGTPGRARYSATNYQLLGAVVEAVDGGSYAGSVRRRVVEPLGLTRTDVFRPEILDRYDSFPRVLVGRWPVHVPHAMASLRPDGGAFSTTAETLRFLDGFLGGELFDPRHLVHMQQEWRRIFPPMQYGTGVMLFEVPRALTLGRRVPPMVGHSGSTGVVLYRVRGLGVDVSGVVNQAARPQLVHQLLLRIVTEVAREGQDVRGSGARALLG